MPTPAYTLRDSPAAIVARLLIAAGMGSDLSTGGSWPVSVSSEPITPDNVITVYNTVGIVDGRSQIDGKQFEHYSAQIRIRASTNVLGWTRSDRIRTYLMGVNLAAVSVGSNNYLVQSFSQIGSINDLGKSDPDSSRNLFTINTLVTVKQV